MFRDYLYYFLFIAHQMLGLGYLEIYGLTFDQIFQLWAINQKGLEMMGEFMGKEKEEGSLMTDKQADALINTFNKLSGAK